MVSDSRSAAPPQRGHSTRRNSETVFSGDSPAPVSATPSGSSTGNSFSGTGTGPQPEQRIIGIGVPQYRCLEMPQSRRR